MGRVKLLSTKHLQPGLVAAAGENGVDITCIPFIEITSLADASMAARLKQFNDKNISLLFTSENAVTAVAPYLDSALSNPVFCISGRTKEAVSQNFPNARIMATAPYGESLAAEIIKSGVSKVLFFCGDKRREVIPGALAKARISLEECVVYKNTATPVAVQDVFDAVAFFSPSAVESFFSLNELKEPAICFAIGTTTASSLENFTGNRVVTSAQPTQASLLQSVYDTFAISNTNTT